MNAILFAFSFLLLSPLAFASFSAEFAGDKQVSLCGCDAVVVPVILKNDGEKEIDLRFFASASSQLNVRTHNSKLTVPAKKAVVESVFVSSACPAQENTELILASAAGSGRQATVVGAVEVVECSKLEMRLDATAPACGFTEYFFVLKNTGKNTEAGAISTNAEDASQVLSQKEFLLRPGEKVRFSVRLNQLKPEDFGKKLVATAKTEKTRAVAEAALTARACPSPTPAAALVATGEQAGQGGQEGSTGVSSITGFFTAFDFSDSGRQLTDALAQARLDYALLLIALVLVAFFYYAVRALETNETEQDRRILVR